MSYEILIVKIFVTFKLVTFVIPQFFIV